MGISEQGAPPYETPSGQGANQFGVADALFGSTQQRVLGLLFGNPERSFFATQIIEHVGAGSGAVQRELKKLAQSGLVTVTRVGNQKHLQANSESPIFNELRGIVRKTVGLHDPVLDALAPIAESIELALIYGSVAKGSESASSDLDLLIVSNRLMLEQVFQHLATAEEAIARSINPTLYSSEEFERRLAQGDSFVARVLSGQTLVLIGELPNGG